MGAVACPVQHQHPRMGGQPAPDQLGAVDDDVVADHRDHRCGRVGGQELLAEPGEVGADGLVGDLVEEAAGVQVDRAEDGAAPVVPGVITCWRRPLAIQVERIQGSRLTWVSSSASTTAPSGSSAMVWRNPAKTWSGSGSPLATSRGRRQLATSRTRRRRVRWLMAGRPRRCHSRAIVQALGWASSRQSSWPSRWLPRRGRPARGRSASPSGPWVL